MDKKPFMWLVVAVLVAGVALGASVAGIVARSNNDDQTTQSSQLAQSTSGSGPASASRANQQSPSGGRQQTQSGDSIQENPAQPGRQLQNRQDQEVPSAQGIGAVTGVTGEIEKIEGNTITVSTPQGPIRATAGADTTIQMFSEVALVELKPNSRVTVIGQREADGRVVARSISILPENSEGLFSRGFADRFGQGAGGQGRPNQDQLNELRQRFQSGEASPEELAQLRQRFQGQGAPGAGPGGFGDGAGLTGTIESVDGSEVTVNTSQGPLPVSVVDSTTIQMLTQATIEELEIGLQVAVVGEQRDDGTITASAIIVSPQGLDGFGRGAGFSQGDGAGRRPNPGP